MTIDFSKYTYIELQESLSTIDKEIYPENYKNLLEAIESYDKDKKAEEVDEYESSVAAYSKIVVTVFVVVYVLIKLHKSGFFS